MRKTATFCRVASYNYSLKVIRKEINYTVQTIKQKDGTLNCAGCLGFTVINKEEKEEEEVEVLYIYIYIHIL